MTFTKADQIERLKADRFAEHLGIELLDCGIGYAKARLQISDKHLNGVGIAQGYATIGAIGFEGRLDYGAIGTVTNLAARLCSAAAGGQILVSARVAGALEAILDAESLGPLTLKGLARPVPIWSVRGLATPGASPA